MATVWVCLACDEAYEPGPGQVCPRCSSPDHIGKENDMPKITVHGGASYDPAVYGEAQPEPEQPQEAPAEQPAPEEASAAPEPEAEAEGPGEESVEGHNELQRPASSDPKSEWLAYAQLLDVEGAEDLTKDQLIAATKRLM
jgi:hypothetical protein